jgi:hypothetical protein
MRSQAALAKIRSGRKLPPPPQIAFSVPQRLLGKKKREIAKCIKKLKLNTDSVFSGEKTGNMPLRPKSLQCYHNHYTNVEKFCCLLGKYDSCIILGETAPKSCIPIDTEVLVLYLRYKFWKKGAPLTDLNGKPVKNGLGTLIKCLGQWKDPDNGNQMHSAIRALHNVRKCNGPYQEKCAACCKLPNKTKFQGCDEHSGCPRLRRCGDSTQSPEFKNELKAMRNLAHRRGYKVTGSSTCLPGDYRDARSFLIGKNTIGDLMMYCIMLFSARAYLRKSEQLGVKGESAFNQELTVIPDGRLEGLNWKVFGKTDQEFRYFFTWKDDDTPEFCFVRHLLILVYVSNWKGGYLFPTMEELDNPPENGIYVTDYTYTSYIHRLKFIFYKVLKRIQIKVGSHT